MKVKPGQRATLAAILGEGTATMPGCLSYIVAEDLADADMLWVTEVWDSKASHDARSRSRRSRMRSFVAAR